MSSRRVPKSWCVLVCASILHAVLTVRIMIHTSPLGLPAYRIQNIACHSQSKHSNLPWVCQLTPGVWTVGLVEWHTVGRDCIFAGFASHYHTVFIGNVMFTKTVTGEFDVDCQWQCRQVLRQTHRLLNLFQLERWISPSNFVCCIGRLCSQVGLNCRIAVSHSDVVDISLGKLNSFSVNIFRAELC